MEKITIKSAAGIELLGVRITAFIACNNYRYSSLEVLDIPLLAKAQEVAGRQIKTITAQSNDNVLIELVPNSEIVDLLFEQSVQQHEVGKDALKLILALAETGVTALIDEATGHQQHRPNNELQETFSCTGPLPSHGKTYIH